MRRVLAAAGVAMALAGMGEAPVRVGCVAEGKAEVPEGLCADLAARLGGTVAEPAGVRLVVTASGPQRLTGRIDWQSAGAWVAGEELTAMVADAPMGPSVWGRWLDALVAGSPPP